MATTESSGLVNRNRSCPKCGGTGREIDDAKTGREMMERRMASGKTQVEVARRMGMGGAYISNLEMGTRHWNRELMVLYLAALT